MTRKMDGRLILFKIFCLGLVLLALQAKAATVTIQLQDKGKQTVENVAVALEPVDKSKMPVVAKPGTMDQVERQFVPRILVVQKNAEVNFPNSDSVKHHIYSFSKTKTFEVKLYKDSVPEPVNFDSSGAVTLGCNIHDWMLAYIYVVDTPWFAKTSSAGIVSLEVPDGDYKLRIYSPRLQAPDSQYEALIKVKGATDKTIHLQAALLPMFDDEELGDEFDEY